MKHLIQLVFLLLISSILAFDQEYPTTSCVFIGCSCGEDADVLIASSQEDDISSQDQSSMSALSLSYDITCGNNPSFKFKIFPARDTSRRYSHQISSLELSQNELKSIPANRLENLDIALGDFSKNLINNISGDAFHGIIRLESLDLSYNELESLTYQIFEPISSTLIQFKLNYNKLNKMSASDLGNALSGLKVLKSLKIIHNQLVEMPDLSGLFKLEDLSLSHNKIEFIKDPNTNEPLLPSNLIDLNLEHNRIKHINHDTFSGLRNLKYINLESNQISTISDDSFTHLTRLLTLNLAKNYLKQIPSKIFFTLINLERVDLSAQNGILRHIDNYAFDRVSNARPIKKIDLSKNRIVSIESKAFCSMNMNKPYANIHQIDLANNGLQNISACLLRQIAKGFSEQHQHHSNQQQQSASPIKPIVKFKPTNYDNRFPSLKCDCEITKSSHYVDLDGDCENNAYNLVPLKNFKCGSEESMNSDEIESNCASMEKYDCSYHQITTIENNSNNNNNNNDLNTDKLSENENENENTNNNNINNNENSNLNNNINNIKSESSDNSNKLPVVNKNNNNDLDHSNTNNNNNKQPNQEQTSQRDKHSQIAITKMPSSAVVESNSNKLIIFSSSKLNNFIYFFFISIFTILFLNN